jgi:serine/threonine protein kinase
MGVDVGDRIADYLLRKEIAQGGMGRVFLAEQLSARRPAALKVSLSDRKTQLGRRLLREASLLAAVQDPHLPQVYNIGRWKKIYYYAMEYIGGPTLKAVLDALFKAAREGGNGALIPGMILHPRQGSPAGPFPLRTMRRICDALAGVIGATAKLHEQQIVHLDITPSNILVGRDGRLVLIDFGLARHLREPLGIESRAKLGTPRYMAPEQLKRSREALDTRVDVYALGLVLYELLLLRPAIEPGPRDEVFARLTRGEILDPLQEFPEFPVGLAALLRKATARDPDDRYPDARALLQDLERFLEGEPPQALGEQQRNGRRLFAFSRQRNGGA